VASPLVPGRTTECRGRALCRPFRALCCCLLRSPFCCCCCCPLLFVKRLVGARFHARRALGSGHHRHWGPAVRADAVRDLPLVGAGLHGGGDSHGPGRRRNERFAWVWRPREIRGAGIRRAGANYKIHRTKRGACGRVYANCHHLSF
jgi:hypothetical protein